MRPLRAVRSRVSGRFRQIGRLRVPLQKREQAPALHTLARAVSPSAACHAKRLECASLLALLAVARIASPIYGGVASPWGLVSDATREWLFNSLLIDHPGLGICQALLHAVTRLIRRSNESATLWASCRGAARASFELPDRLDRLGSGFGHQYNRTAFVAEGASQFTDQVLLVGFRK